jgi:hypothetical protein
MVRAMTLIRRVHIHRAGPASERENRALKFASMTTDRVNAGVAISLSDNIPVVHSTAKRWLKTAHWLRPLHVRCAAESRHSTALKARPLMATSDSDS